MKINDLDIFHLPLVFTLNAHFMKKLVFTFLALFTFYLAVMAQDYTITASGVAFSPNTLTINAGETVAWVNQGGTHNVNGSLQSYPANPAGFSSGSAMPAPWTFSHTFNTPGTYQYHCDPHIAVGMTGTITVLPVASGDVIITEFMYNVPSADTLEFIELYNNGSNPVDMEGWALSSAVDFIFPSFTLAPGDYTIVTNNAVGFQAAFGISAFQWVTGTGLNNSGESIKLLNDSGMVEDSVAYLAGTGGWPATANGQGPSNVLCDYNTDNNDPANWAAAVTPTGVLIGTTEILANPGGDSECPTGAVIGFLYNSASLLENAGIAYAYVTITGGNAVATQVTVSLNPISTASGADYNATLPVTLTFPAGVASDTMEIPIAITDDTEIELPELLVLDLTNATNGATISPNGEQFALTILDNDAPQTNALIITGIYDAQPGAAGVKGIELQALENIADLSVFGLEAANNGTGSTGVETPLPAVSLNAGDCFYVADDSTKFFDFFGFYPGELGDAANINGDDAILLFENNIVIDIFGEPNVDGSGQPWEYLDGWAYRKDGTGPDGNTFVLNNWTFSGVGALVRVPNNPSAPNPLPACHYSSVAPPTAIAKNDNATTPFNTPVTINVLANDELPNPLTSLGVTSGPSNGMVTVNGLNNITYTPNQDYCGTEVFTYEICDAAGCDEATVTVIVQCQISYPVYDIATVKTVNASGHPDSLNVTCQLKGIVHGFDFQGSASVQFVIIDQTSGITIFSPNSFGYTVNEGDEVIVRGKITEFNCLTQVAPDTLWAVSPGNPLATPQITAFLNESFESELVELTNLQMIDPAQWLGNGSSFNVQVINIFNPQDTFIMRIDNDCPLATMPNPAPGGMLHARGLGGQFDTAPCDDGYQFFPRYLEDIIPLTGTEEELLGEKISLYPNPAGERLFIKTDLEIESVILSNLLGQQLGVVKNPGNYLDVSQLDAGVYLLTFRVGETAWTGKFVKK